MNSNDPSLSQSVGLLRRFGALLYDALLLIAVLFFASLLTVAPFNIVYGHPIYILPGHPFYPIFMLYIYMIGFLFLAWFWTHGGQTLGMKAWSLRLQQINGQSITWKWALFRFFSVLLFWFPAAAGHLLLNSTSKQFIYIWIAPIVIDYLWCFFNPDRLALHDKLSQTRLVRIPRETQR